MSLNKVMLIGHVGRDPEVRYLAADRVVCTFSLATSETYTDRSTGEKKTDTEWHRIEMWDALAKTAEKYVKKGNLIYIEGKLRSESWKDKDGNEKTGVKIRATAMNLLGSKSHENQPAGTTNEKPAETATVVKQHEQPVKEDSSNDDLPF